MRLLNNVSAGQEKAQHSPFIQRLLAESDVLKEGHERDTMLAKLRPSPPTLSRLRLRLTKPLWACLNSKAV